MRLLVFLFGIVAPIAAIWVEMSFKYASGLIDPLPTPYHLFLIILVAIANILAFMTTSNTAPSLVTVTRWLLGIAAGISLFYSFLFIPLYPFGLLAFISVFLAPFGVLAFSPVLAFLASKQAWKMINSLPEIPHVPFSWRGVLHGFLLVALIELPSTITRYGMTIANDPAQAGPGLMAMRIVRNDDVLLRACYERPHQTDLLGHILTLGKPVDGEAARKIYYKVTGTPFNGVPVPTYFDGPFRPSVDDDDTPRTWRGVEHWEQDNDLAGQAVGGIVRNVSLANSVLDTKVDVAAGVSRTDWVMDFTGKSQQQQEARAQILLPPGGVLSQAILWVDGVPRQAAFAGRAEAKAAYRSIVHTRRDPLLVTSSGPDRVQIQCFPITPATPMRIKVTVTAPLQIASDGKARLMLPQFAERNFRVTPHKVQVAATLPLSTKTSLLLVQPAANKSAPDFPYSYSALLDNAKLSSGSIAADFNRPAGINKVWSEGAGVANHCLSETLAAAPALSKPTNLVVVVDGSALMHRKIDTVLRTLKEIPPGIQLTLIHSGDAVDVITRDCASASNKWNDALHSLKNKWYTGGQDAMPAMTRAFSLVYDLPQPAILWLHAAQPVEFKAAVPLRNVLRAAGGRIKFYDYEVEASPNRVLESLEGLDNVYSVKHVLGSSDDLKFVFDKWQGINKDQQFVIALQPSASIASDTYKAKVSFAPLWAKKQIDMLLRNEANKGETVAASVDKGAVASKNSARAQALNLARTYRVITPVSGAVVLESKEQYRQNNIEPPPSEVTEIPTRPEPETWLLLAIGLAMVVLARRRQLQQARVRS